MIAISYRREDSLPIAGRLYDRLQAKFGKQNVFMDFDSIPPGVDFREQIKQTIERADVVIAIIGPHWVGKRSDSSQRIDDPTDFVRLEIEYALQKGIPLIPLLINNTPMPKPGKLPQEIEALAFRNALPLDTGIDFHNHADRLISGISNVLGAATRPEKKRNLVQWRRSAISRGDVVASVRSKRKIIVWSAGILAVIGITLVTWSFAAHLINQSWKPYQPGQSNEPGEKNNETLGTPKKPEGTFETKITLLSENETHKDTGARLGDSDTSASPAKRLEIAEENLQRIERLATLSQVPEREMEKAKAEVNRWRLIVENERDTKPELNIGRDLLPPQPHVEVASTMSLQPSPTEAIPGTEVLPGPANSNQVSAQKQQQPSPIAAIASRFAGTWMAPNNYQLETTNPPALVAKGNPRRQTIELTEGKISVNETATVVTGTDGQRHPAVVLGSVLKWSDRWSADPTAVLQSTSTLTLKSDGSAAYHLIAEVISGPMKGRRMVATARMRKDR